MAQGDKFQYLEETGEGLVCYINSSQLEKLRLVKDEHHALFDHRIETKKIVTQILKDVAEIEERAGQTLMDMEEEKMRQERELESLGEQLRQATAKSQMTDAELQFVAQLYYLITKIKWEYDTQPNILKGVHYGADLATPINTDTSTRSRSDVSDQLWGFVSTEW
ncbi:Kinetochore protein Spc24 [Liparis tanakae]|uniref:Kinetochore protein Spc24 n=1 Tax=Liparis tanakae TaxID=230148 RepID=A0A4Z2H185_9TELE|nr:Kinetochore protein Spc24 [Liparis tanakae]